MNANSAEIIVRVIDMPVKSFLMLSPHSNYIICNKKAGIPQNRKALRAPAPSCYVTLLSVAQQAVPSSLGGDKHEPNHNHINYLTSFDS